ncbi:MAG TPA: PIG-L family deacetylase [Gemmatimonadales bacterium]|nr:PIG-L family deacetylase [Gemmatimonadales bacterium]
MHRQLLPAGSTLLILFLLLSQRLAAQLEPPSSGGAVALDQELRMLGHYKRVLMVGAHPDDEDTELLTVLVRGMGSEAAYLSLNRGEGGQNLIGSELGEALGLLRTEELLAARRLDGARQYFTRAYDFGYSKSIAETWQHWPRDSILKDVVRIVRRFRPQVIVSIFSGTPRDGHGQHQAAGWAALEAFRAAGDSSRFPELFHEENLLPWTPQKVYRSARFDSTAATLTLNGGILDPAVGKSFHQIAMAGRSLHRSQDMGQLQRIGPSKVRLALVEDRTSAGTGGLFAGIDTSIAAMPLGERRGAGSAELIRASPAPELSRYSATIDSVLVARGNLSRQKQLLARAARSLEQTVSAPPQATPARRGVYYTRGIELEDQLGHLNAAAWHLGRVVFDAVVDDDRVVTGQMLRWTLSAWNASEETRIADMRAAECIPLAECRSPDQEPEPQAVPPGQVDTLSVEYPVLDQPPSTPYFLTQPRAGDLYRWPDPQDGIHPGGSLPFGEPFESPTFLGSVEVNAGQSDSLGAARLKEAVYRFNDQARGEVRRPVTVVPRIDVKLDPGTELWSLNSAVPHRFTVTLTHGARDTTSGTVSLQLPRGWPAVAPQRFRFTQEDERESFAFEVKPPPRLQAGPAEIRAVARDTGEVEYALGVLTVDYPHIRPRSYTKPARADLQIAPLALPRRSRIGYVRGAADRVPEALAGVDIPVTLITPAVLERGNLDRYNAIIVGPRAYETDAALVENNRRLLEYARRGGLVIVQYQQHQFFNGRFAPYPMKVGGTNPTVSHDRVVDENAPMRVLVPTHPAVRSPNRLGPADWKGWVQERGLYFARSWDRRYRAILETHDPGEPPLAGGLLIATVGKGTYIYTGLSFFRQLPAGVPGAFRLFANLLALRK